jgi:addiction module HigA family antidote
MTQAELALRIGCSPVLISRIIHGKCEISARLSIKISRVLGTSDMFWYGLTYNYRVWKAENDR